MVVLSLMFLLHCRS